MKEPQKITVKSKSGNNYIMLLYNCESCNKEVKRANSYKSLNKGKIYCRSCSNKINSRKERVDGEFKVCKSCEQNLPISKFSKSNTGVNHNPCCSKCYALKKFNITRTDYVWQLKQLILKHLPLWQALFAIENYNDLRKPIINYKEKIENGLSRNIKRIN